MQWTSIGEFFAMGGYGEYIWGAYGVSFLLLLIEVMALRKRLRMTRQTVRQQVMGGSR